MHPVFSDTTNKNLNLARIVTKLLCGCLLALTDPFQKNGQQWLNRIVDIVSILKTDAKIQISLFQYNNLSFYLWRSQEINGLN